MRNLTEYDFILVNSSGGKDSQAMLDYVARLAKSQDVLGRVVVVHCDLGRVEWKGVAELAEEQATHYGFRFLKVSRPQGDLLDHVEKRGMWPSPKQRYCTSDHKRGQVRRIMTQLVSEKLDEYTNRRPGRQIRILNCMGMRAQESTSRAKLDPFAFDGNASNGKRHVDNWLPIHAWTVEQVWDRIRESGVRHHEAYDLGMPRLSCCFCIFAPKSALLLAAKHNPELLNAYVAVEQKINHKFRQDVSLVEIQTLAQSDAPAEAVKDWSM